MAGDWVPIRMDLIEDPATIGISHAVKLDRFSVVGRLLAVWSWFSRQTVDGIMPFATREDLDRVAERKGFAEAMRIVGWINETPEGGITIPDFQVWLGQSAKKRFKQSLKKGNHRSCPQSVPKKSDNLFSSLMSSSGLARDGPGEGQSWEEFLSGEWSNAFAGPDGKQTDPARLFKFFSSLMRRIEAPRILARIRDQSRRTTEPTWEFEAFFNANGKAKNGNASASHESDEEKKKRIISQREAYAKNREESRRFLASRGKKWDGTSFQTGTKK